MLVQREETDPEHHGVSAGPADLLVDRGRKIREGREGLREGVAPPVRNEVVDLGGMRI